MLADFARVVIDMRSLTSQVVADGMTETGVNDPVHGPRSLRDEAPAYLVFTLRARLEALETMDHEMLRAEWALVKQNWK